MTSVIPPVLASYIQQCIDERSLTLLTSVLDTPTNWVLTRFLVSAFHQHNHGQSPAVALPDNAVAVENRIIFVSVYRSLDTWIELARKCGLNLHDVLTSSKLCYVDGLSLPGRQLPGILPLETITLKDLDRCLTTAIKTLSDRNRSNKIIVVFDGLDFLLACQPKITSHDVQQMLVELQSRVHGVVATCAADSALLHQTDAAATPLELEHTTLARGLAHQARWVFQLRPLETGQSKEVSGSVRVSKGGAWESIENATVLDEGEWLFHARNDGGVKIWGRGEA